ncbi:DUF6918 family protein [Sinimarinibacterium flocculans]|uniref:DUF6918 family protein n=1 Tax=Sinimarinibacterium flocculans TaxID=985250 RepID=UPI003518A9EF
MTTLADILWAPAQRDAVVRDAIGLIESHVGGRGGLRGMSLKTGLAMIKAAKPGILDRAVRKLLPEFALALDPLYQDFRSETGGDFAAYLQKHNGRATAALLAVADRWIGRASPVAQGAYARLRGSAEGEVKAAIPGLARLIGRYLESGGDANPGPGRR